MMWEKEREGEREKGEKAAEGTSRDARFTVDFCVSCALS